MKAAPRRINPIARALWTGAAAGLLVGAGEALLRWPRLSQFLPGLLGKLRAALLAGALYAVVGSLAAAALTAALVGLHRFTALGPFLRARRRYDRIARALNPRAGLTDLSLALAGVPALAGAAAGAYAVGLATLIHRHNSQLITAVTVGATLLFLAAGGLATLVLGALIERGLRLLPAPTVRRLAHPLAPAVAAIALVGLGAAATAWAARHTLGQLDLRPHLAALGLSAGVLLLWRPLARLRPRAFLHPLPVVVPAAVALLLGGSPAARKGANAAAGLFPLLGEVLPRPAPPTPGALDAECLADLRPRSPEDVAFVPLPAGVPADANVILITIDALRADHLGAYGYPRPTTPALDALAAQGGLFENAWAHAPSTRYSMPAILTGRYPSQVLWDTSIWWPGVRPENHTLAEVLHERGLRTGAIFSYDYFDKKRHMDQGFDDYDNSSARLHVGRDPAATHGSSGVQQADAAIRYLDAHSRERFFLWVHFYDPHFEYERHPQTALFGDGTQDLYDGEIRFTDDQIARVLARLEELDLSRKTIIVVTGDHGEGFGEHGIQFHGYHLYAAQTRIPLIIKVPGLAPRRLAMPVGHVDILPTLANLAGAPAEASMAGRSLVGELAGVADGDRDRDVFQEVSYEGPTERRALASKGHHLIYNMVPDGTYELYDLARDPAEAHDTWDSAGEALAGRLRALTCAARFTPEAVAQLAAAVRRERPTPGLPAAADFGDAVRLLGIDLGSLRVRPGEDLDVTWYFESLKHLDGDWRLFVHVEGPGRFLGDHDPVGGALPFSRWQPGQFIADHQVLRVPPGTRPGTYTIYAGIFDRKGRLAVSRAGERDDGQRRVRVAQVQVTE